MFCPFLKGLPGGVGIFYPTNNKKISRPSATLFKKRDNLLYSSPNNANITKHHKTNITICKMDIDNFVLCLLISGIKSDHAM